MKRSPLLWVVAGVAVLLVGMAGAATSAAADPPAPPGTPTAITFAGTPTVGPLFKHGYPGRHSCTASVIASPTRDLILTAAHCVSGTAVGWQFVPGYDAGAAPDGVWTVVHAYLDPRWINGQDPQHDYAILQVARQQSGNRSVGVQDVTGANVVDLAPRPGQQITDVAYNAGTGDQPIRCAVPTYDTSGYPTFNCHGYVDGSSGSPWLAYDHGIPVVRGVIGGLHQGGCYEYTSYSSAFRPDIYAVIYRAVERIHPDTAPQAGSDGCSTGL